MKPPTALALLALAVVILVAIAFADDGVGAPKESHDLVIGDFFGARCVLYRQGESVHVIRDSSITAMIFTGDAQRNTIYFGGGTLANEITREEWVEAEREYNRYKSENNGADRPLTFERNDGESDSDRR